ncbi:DUF354 domain-containing protein [Salinirubrum litoreum]|uniref:DUF354 domain-containing protein n=1 Tax=Salinirubrum litoreum TaxID=1126234 RepID=A0ABD5RCB1_9EURY|nr:DUF354 domain-containing protein [Salinirubrum litoreum]
MQALVTVQHPAHVHFFRHAIGELEDRGHEVHVAALDKDVALSLLDAYDIDHTVLGTRSGSLVQVALSQATIEARLVQLARRLDPDVITAIGGLTAAHVGAALGIRSVVFTDTEHARLSNRLTFPFADEVWTPDCYWHDEGADHHRYPGFHELAYLHPDRFTPDPAVLERRGVDPDERFVVLRLTGWDAVHDIGDSGLDGLPGLVRQLESRGASVYVTAEGELPDALADRELTVEPSEIHHLLAYADLFVGESPTMATESAVLGTPAVYVHSQPLGYTDELADYGLLWGFHGDDRNARGAERALELLDAADTTDWDAHREQLLAAKVDTTDVVVERLLGDVGATGTARTATARADD